MRHIAILVTAATIGLFPIAACSSSTSGSSPDGGTSSGGTEDGGSAGTSVSQACKDYGAAQCAALFRCNPFEGTHTYGDTATCAVSQAAVCHSHSLDKGYARASAACAAGLAAQSCDAFLQGATASGCQGTLAADATCTDSEQCATGHCGKPAGSPCGKCDSPSEGSACTRASDCAFDQYCKKDSGACVVNAKKGEPCLGRSCGVNLECAGANTCVDQGKEGDTCGQDGSVSCGIGLTCSGGTCKANTFVDAGGTTDHDKGVYCKGRYADDTNTTCAPDLKEGQACEDNGPRCVDGYLCSDAVCKLIQPNASSCP